MSARGRGGLLLAYPRAWRARYGEELLAMIDDGLEGSRAPARLRAELLWSGLRERLAAAGGGGGERERLGRSGVRLALVAWALMVAGGSVFAKTSERWSEGVPAGSRAVPAAAYAAVQALAAAGAVVVFAAVLSGMPALVRELRAGAWPRLRGPARRALGASAVLLVLAVALGVSARTLTAPQRNGGSAPYAGLFALTGLAGVLFLAAWTALALRAERVLSPGRLLRRVELGAAGAVVVLTPALTAAIGIWWAALASDAPWVLSGAPAGTGSGVLTANLLLAGVLALAASAVALLSAGRLFSAARARPDAPA